MIDLVSTVQLVEKKMPHSGYFVCFEDHEIALLAEFTWKGATTIVESMDFWLLNKLTYRRYSLHSLEKCCGDEGDFYRLAIIAETPAPETSKLLVSEQELGLLDMQKGNRFSLRINCIERQEADYYDANPCEFKENFLRTKEGCTLVST